MSKDAVNHRPSTLTQRERQVVRLLVRGFALGEIANELGVSPAAVDRCHSIICEKLRLSERTELYEYAVAIGVARRFA